MSVCVECFKPMDDAEARVSLLCPKCRGLCRAMYGLRPKGIRRISDRNADQIGRKCRVVMPAQAPEGMDGMGDDEP